MNSIDQLKWDSAVAECRAHVARLEAALSRMVTWMPLDGVKLERLSDEDTAWLDQFLYRFTKLQDAMGERVLVDGLRLLGEDFTHKPFLDALNRMEALGLIPSAAWWLELRELRNQVAHEYPDRRSEQATAINAIQERCDAFLSVFGSFVAAVESRVKTGEENPPGPLGSPLRRG